MQYNKAVEEGIAMGFLKSIKEFFTGFFYVVDVETLIEYINRNVALCFEDKNPFCTEFNMHFGGEKRFVQVFNNAFDEDAPGREGISVVCGEKEYGSVEEFVREALRFAPQYFKIELTLSDDVFLNEYKAAHPELDPDKY